MGALHEVLKPFDKASVKKEELEKKGKKIHVISFPKCGRTWLRVMLGDFLCRHFDIQEAHERDAVLKPHRLRHKYPYLPKFIFTHDDYAHWRKPSELERDKSAYATRNVIFLVRNPRDIIVSLFFEQSKRLRDPRYLENLRHLEVLVDVRERLHPYDGDLKSFIREEVGGVESLLEFLAIWEREKTKPRRFLLVRYEDLHRDPVYEFRRILQFAKFHKIRKRHVKQSVRFASFDHMKDMERTEAFKSHKLQAVDKENDESYKVRKGKVCGYEDYLDAEDIDYVNRMMSARLPAYYGYSPCLER